MIYNQDAAALGGGLAFTAQADNPSAIFYNPAGINQLEGANISAGTTIIIPSTTFKSASGLETHTKDKVSPVPNVYITHKLTDQFSAGFGFFCPFGLSIEWPGDWVGKDAITFAEMKTFFLNPAISWQIHPKISLAAGFDYVFSEVELRRAISLSLPQGTFGLEADACGPGYNLGALIHLTKNIKFGISYRSSIDLEYDGHAEAKILGATSSTGASTHIKLPRILAVGLSTEVMKKWTLEFDMIWVDWSTFDKLTAEFKQPILEQTTMTIPRNWYDGFYLAFGAKYQLDKPWAFRGGYVFSRSPIPEETLDPILPDANKHVVSLGVQYESHSLNATFGYQAQFFERRTVSKTIVAYNPLGSYESFTHSIALNLTYRF